MAGIDLNPESRSPGKTYSADTYLPTNLPTYLPTYLSVYLPPSLSTCTYPTYHHPLTYTEPATFRPIHSVQVNAFPLDEQRIETRARLSPFRKCPRTQYFPQANCTYND